MVFGTCWLVSACWGQDEYNPALSIERVSSYSQELVFPFLCLSKLCRADNPVCSLIFIRDKYLGVAGADVWVTLLNVICAESSPCLPKAVSCSAAVQPSTVKHW